MNSMAAAIAGALSVAAILFAAAPVHAADCRAAPRPSVDWSDCNKSRLMLPESALDGSNLFGADFSYTDLRQSSFVGANLEKATLTRATLAGSKADDASFVRAEAYRVNLSGVSARQASFVSAELQRANLTGADLTGADFQKAELGRAIVTGAVLTGARFPMANLARTNFNEATFEGPIDLAGAFLLLTRIEGLDLSQATGLQQWQVDQACGDADTRLPDGLETPADWPCDGD